MSITNFDEVTANGLWQEGKEEGKETIMPDNDVLFGTKLAFAEASKDPKFSDKDATAVLWAAKNRVGKRWGETLDEVVFAPSQFSGVGSNEWNKAETGNMTEDEQNIFKRFMQISYGVNSGSIPDPTGGADHYFNPKLVKPSWSKKMKKVYTSGVHDYYKE